MPLLPLCHSSPFQSTSTSLSRQQRQGHPLQRLVGSHQRQAISAGLLWAWRRAYRPSPWQPWCRLKVPAKMTEADSKPVEVNESLVIGLNGLGRSGLLSFMHVLKPRGFQTSLTLLWSKERLADSHVWKQLQVCSGADWDLLVLVVPLLRHLGHEMLCNQNQHSCSSASWLLQRNCQYQIFLVHWKILPRWFNGG